MSQSINRIIGQLDSIKSEILNDEACDESLTQILAIKGGVERVGLDLLSKGVLDCLQDYSKEELSIVFKNMFKLD
jgi:DNA-binding FrmR family transcriptional regulator